MSHPLRPYQRQAIDEIYGYWEHSDGNPLVVLPTGTGKSLVIAQLIQEALGWWPDTGILVLTHVKELLSQTFAELVELWPDAPVGLYSAGLGKRDLHAQVIIAGIQSIHKRAYDIPRRIDIVLIDEAHLVPDTDSTMYRKFLAELKIINKFVKVIGLTATPYRLGQGMLTEGKNALFDNIAFDYPIIQAVEDGYLSPLVSKRMETEFDLSGVGTRNGDFIPGQLETAVDLDEVTTAAVAEMVEHGRDRRAWLAFCAGIKHAEHVRDAIRSHGVSCETVIGDTPSGERDDIIKAYRRGEIRCLTSVGVLTTGFNVPHVDLIGMLRPTKSIGLYVQIAGRGTRLAPAKPNCLVLDFAGNVARHGPIDRVRPKRKGEGAGDAPTKTCPQCKSIVFAGVRFCPDCGFEFEMSGPKIEAKASTLDIMSNGQPEWVDVTMVLYALHEKEGKPPSMRVDYICGLSRHREWVTLEHSGFAREKACRWWRIRAETTPPNKIADALGRKGELRMPLQIAIRPSGRFTEIVGTRF